MNIFSRAAIPFLLVLCTALAEAGSARVALQVPGAKPGSARAFRLGVPFQRGLLEDSPHFQILDREGKPRALLSRTIARWPDGSPHWILFEGKTEQEKISLVLAQTQLPSPLPVKAGQSSDGVWSLENSVLRLRASQEGEELFYLEGKGSTWRGNVRLRLNGKDARASACARQVFWEQIDGWFRGLRIQGEFASGAELQRPLRFDLRLGVSGNESRVDIDLTLANGSRGEIELEDFELLLKTEEAARQFWICDPKGLRALVRPSEPLVLGSRGGPDLAPIPRSLCWESSFACCVRLEGMAELWPKEIAFRPQGEIAIRILPGKHRLLGETATSGKAVLRQHSPGLTEQEHRPFFEDLGDFALARILASGSEGLDGQFFSKSSEIENGMAEVLREGKRRLFEEMDSHRGWRDFGDHRLRGRWSHLEFDTAAGLLRHSLRHADPESMRRAKQALEHWKTQDRFAPFPGSARGGLPAMHGKEHAAGARFESGHLWVEGLLLDYAIAGDLSSREAAMEMGDALLASKGWGAERRGVERHWAWPLIAFAALQEFFPDRGYDKAMEEIVEEIFLFREPRSGAFFFEGRMAEEEGEGFVNSWLSGGLLLEALDRYRVAGGKRDVVAAMRALERLIQRELWDRNRQRFLHTLRWDFGKAQATDRWGRLQPVREIYLLAGLLRVQTLAAGGSSSPRPLRRRLSTILKEFRWQDEEVGNDLSLLLRAESGIFAGFNGL